MAPAPGDREKFRLLKKAMQLSFRPLRQAARAHTLAAGRQIEEFACLAESMVSYSGFGDAAYPGFLAAVQTLRQSALAADLQAFRQAVAAISQLQSQCHDRAAGLATHPPDQGSQ